jgi:ABC-type transporter Mla subunit MlaD
MPDVESWHQEWRNQWEKVLDLLTGIRDALVGRGDIVTALEDLQAAVADNTEVSTRVGALVDQLQDQVTTLQQTVDDLIAQGNTDLGPVTDQIKAITEALTAAEAPNTPAEPPVEEVPEAPPADL